MSTRRATPVLVCALVLTAGCSSGDDGAAPAPSPTTASPTSSSTPTTTPSPSAGPATTTTPAPGAGLALPTAADPAVTTRASAPVGRVSASLVAALSYDYRTLDTDLAAARAATTGTFGRQVRELQSTVITPQAARQQVVSRTTVRGIGSVTRTGTGTTYVVVTDQATSKGGGAPTTARTAARVTADARGRISRLDVLTGAAPRTSSALLDGATRLLAPLVGPTAEGVAQLRAASTPAYAPQVDRLGAAVRAGSSITGVLTGVGLASANGSSYALVVCLTATSSSGSSSSQQVRVTFVPSGGRLLIDDIEGL